MLHPDLGLWPTITPAGTNLYSAVKLADTFWPNLGNFWHLQISYSHGKSLAAVMKPKRTEMLT